MKFNVTVALAGIFLVLIQPAIPAQETEKAIAAIKAMGGKVAVDKERSGNPVVGVDLSHTKIRDASLEQLKAWPNLEHLILKNTPLTDDGMVYINGLTNLEVLELSRTKVTDKGLKHLRDFTKIVRLDLSGTEVSDQGLEHLKGLAHLRSLNLTDTRVTDAGVQALKKVLPNVLIKR